MSLATGDAVDFLRNCPEQLLNIQDALVATDQDGLQTDGMMIMNLALPVHRALGPCFLSHLLRTRRHPKQCLNVGKKASGKKDVHLF